MTISIPHGDDIRFVKEIVELQSDSVVTLCEFDPFPSIAMLVEASAQTAAAYMTSTDDRGLLGFLVGVRRFILLEKDLPSKLHFDLVIKNALDSMYYGVVRIFSNEKEVANGELSFYLTDSL